MFNQMDYFLKECKEYEKKAYEKTGDVTTELVSLSRNWMDYTSSLASEWQEFSLEIGRRMSCVPTDKK